MSQDYMKMLHEAEKELLIEVLKLFEKYNITYYAIGGTLIGAVRNQGFIPWDDDIDLAIPRDDYEKIIQVMNDYESENPMVGMDYYRNDEELYFYPARLVHKKYVITDARLKDRESHPWIDLLPIDGWPEGKLKSRLFKAKMLYYRFLLGLHYSDNLRDKKRSLGERIIIKTAQITHIGKLINPTRVKDKLDRTLKSGKLDQCRIVGTCMGAYFFHEFVPKTYFGKGTEMEFEGIKLNVPEKTDKYLRHMYGDYMTPREGEYNHTDETIQKIN